MKTFDLSDVQLFESLLELNFEENYIDLHNDYDFKSHKLTQAKTFTLTFLNIKTGKELLVCFENTDFIEFFIIGEDNSSVDNFHRARHEKDGKLFDEIENKKCYYIEFTGESKIELLSSKLYIVV